jgi:3-phenylpropionate/trans-cinnamate dioxygenase ferredoxin subunit
MLRAIVPEMDVRRTRMGIMKRFIGWGRRDGATSVVGATPTAAPDKSEVTYVRCAQVSDLHPGEVKQLRLRGGHEVALALIDGVIWAVEAYCPHEGWPFKWSEIDSEAGRAPHLLCGRHGWRFCMDTGDILDPPSFDRMAVYPVRVEGEDVLVGLPGFV